MLGHLISNRGSLMIHLTNYPKKCKCFPRFLRRYERRTKQQKCADCNQPPSKRLHLLFFCVLDPFTITIHVTDVLFCDACFLKHDSKHPNFDGILSYLFLRPKDYSTLVKEMANITPDYTMCSNCRLHGLIQGKKFRFCKQCNDAFYCSKECQREHWPVHKESCQKQQKGFPPCINDGCEYQITRIHPVPVCSQRCLRKVCIPIAEKTKKDTLKELWTLKKKLYKWIVLFCCVVIANWYFVYHMST